MCHSVILGLGSNEGDNLNHLRLAVQCLHKLEGMTVLAYSPLYASEAMLGPGAPIEWSKPFINMAVACSTVLDPSALLVHLSQMEKHLGRKRLFRWAPRCIDIDILAWDQAIIHQGFLQVPHPGLTQRPFALWPLLDLWPKWEHPAQSIGCIVAGWGSRFEGKAPYRTQQIPQTLAYPGLMGILNVTPDSFSDGGDYTTVDRAVAHVQQLVREGAEVIDVGAESTRPGATLITVEREWHLLEPVLEAIKAQWKYQLFKPRLSLDTRHAEVLERAILLGVNWVNDVGGLLDDKMKQLIAKAGLQCVLMHNLGVPAQKAIVLDSKQDAYSQVREWVEKRLLELQQAGILLEQIIFDLGIGFGKTADQSFQLMRNVPKFRSLGVPLLVGHSRKSFLEGIANQKPSERDTLTAVISYQLAKWGVHYLRVHNVGLNAQTLRLVEKLGKEDGQ